jgi:deoxycytidylate deaminase
MYTRIDSELQLVAPFVKDYISRCYTLAEHSTCNRRKVGAIIETKNERRFIGISGSITEPCKNGNSSYCLRKDTLPFLEYITCPSHCAEGAAILDAAKGNAEFEGSKLFTTSFPCQRCKDLIIDFGISELYFNGFKKNDDAREHEKLYVAQMHDHGTKVFRLDSAGIINRLIPTDEEIDASKNIELFPAFFWAGLMFNHVDRQRMFKRTADDARKKLGI